MNNRIIFTCTLEEAEVAYRFLKQTADPNTLSIVDPIVTVFRTKLAKSIERAKRIDPHVKS